MYIHSTLIINEVQETPSAYVVINIVSNRDSVRPSRIKLYIYIAILYEIYIPRRICSGILFPISLYVHERERDHLKLELFKRYSICTCTTTDYLNFRGFVHLFFKDSTHMRLTIPHK